MRHASLEPIHFSKELIFDRQDFDNSASLVKKNVRQKLYRSIVGFYGVSRASGQYFKWDGKVK